MKWILLLRWLVFPIVKFWANLFPSVVRTMKSYRIPYEVEGKQYILVMPRSRVKKRWTVYSGDTDVTEEVEKYAGPERDFFSLPLTPSMLDRSFSTLSFHTPEGVKIFEKNEKIIL